MCFFICISQPAGFLRNLYRLRIRRKGKRHNPFVTKLFFHLRIINSISCNSRWCSCLETKHFDSERFQGIRQIIGCLQTIWACIIADISVDASCLQVCSCTEYNCLTVINGSGIQFYTCDLSVFDDKFCYFSLFDGQIFLIFQSFSHLCTVRLFICLRS